MLNPSQLAAIREKDKHSGASVPKGPRPPQPKMPGMPKIPRLKVGRAYYGEK
jgi:hypothetical protein